MLSELAIKNFAIIDDIRISFRPGLSVLTGETGAGKSIIIEAVNLLLGSRASADLIRTGEDSAELEACFDIAPESVQAEMMAEQGIDPAEGMIIRRVIAASGRNKVFINSRQSSMQLLKDLTGNLAGISSQHEHQGLLNEENHLDILDRFAGTTGLKNEVRSLYRKLSALVSEREKLITDTRKFESENELLRHQIDEIDKADIKEDEDSELEKEKAYLKNASLIHESLNTAVWELYTKEGSVIEQIDTIGKALEKYGSLDPVLEEKARAISGFVFELQDAAEELRAHASGIVTDPEALENTEARLDLIQNLKRKYGGNLENLFSQYREMKEKFAATSNAAERIHTLETEIEVLKKTHADKVTALSEKRHTEAQTLSGLVIRELGELEMQHADFKAEVAQSPADPESDALSVNGMKVYPAGIDRACFLISPNPGEKRKPLSKIASGGELSRIVLALKVVLSRSESLETLIFDEVDAGIGGATSEKIGLKLKKLAGVNQVICITHLAQIAKYGTTHFKITKSVSGSRTAAAIIPLETRPERVEEIARMIGGSEITRTTKEHAAEMLDGEL